MRGAVTKSGGNASVAVERKEGMEKSKRARRRKPETAKTNVKPSRCLLTARDGRFMGERRRPVCVPATNRVSDPMVWSGRALQEVFVDLVVSGLASMYPAFDWSICSGPSWISARLRSD